MAVFHQIWTPEGPNVVKIISARVSDSFSVIFPGGVNFGTTIEKIGPLSGPVERPYLPYVHFFSRKIFFRPGLFCGRPEQLKMPPKAPGLASVAAEVPWKQ